MDSFIVNKPYSKHYKNKSITETIFCYGKAVRNRKSLFSQSLKRAKSTYIAMVPLVTNEEKKTIAGIKTKLNNNLRNTMNGEELKGDLFQPNFHIYVTKNNRINTAEIKTRPMCEESHGCD